MSSMMSWGCRPSMLQPTDCAVPRISLIVPAVGRRRRSVLHPESLQHMRAPAHAPQLSLHTLEPRGSPPGDSKPPQPAAAHCSPRNTPRVPHMPSTTPHCRHLCDGGCSHQHVERPPLAPAGISPVHCQGVHLHPPAQRSPESSRASDLCRICRAMFTISSKLTLPLCLTARGSDSTS